MRTLSEVRACPSLSIFIPPYVNVILGVSSVFLGYKREIPSVGSILTRVGLQSRKMGPRLLPKVPEAPDQQERQDPVQHPCRGLPFCTA